MIYTDKVISDGLYNVKDGELFKYKAKGGSTKVRKIQRLVRCKDCKYQGEHFAVGIATCGNKGGMVVAPDRGFCSCGEPKGGEEE